MPYANSVDPDQTPRSAASDLGLQCLLKSLLWDTRQIHSAIPVITVRIQCQVLPSLRHVTERYND